MSASAIYNLFKTAQFDVICQGLNEKEWVISNPNEVSEPGSLLNMVISRASGIEESNTRYNIRKGSYPEKKPSFHETLILKILEAGALPWQDDTLIFEKLLIRPFYDTLDVILSHATTSPTLLKKLHHFEVNLKSFEGMDFKKGFNLPALHIMAARGNEEGIRVLLKHGWDINGLDSSHRTPLFYARYPNMAQLLLDNGIDPEIRDQNQTTAATYWSQKNYFTMLEVQALQKTLPQVRRKKGSANIDDLKAFIEIVLKSKKTKVVNEARRLGVSLTQEIDGKPMMQLIVDKTAEQLIYKLNHQTFSRWDRLVKIEDHTAMWLINEWDAKGVTVGEITKDVLLSFFGMLSLNYPPAASIQTSDDLILNIEKKKEVEKLWFPWLKQIKTKNEGNLFCIQKMISSWIYSVVNKPTELWLCPSSSGEIPLMKLYNVMEEWNEQSQLVNPDLKFNQFFLGQSLHLSSKKFFNLEQSDYYQYSDFLNHPRAFEVILGIYLTSEDNLYLKSHHAFQNHIKYNDFGFKENNVMYPLITHFINEGAVWPVNAPLLDVYLESLSDKDNHEAFESLKIFKERSLLNQKIKEVDKTDLKISSPFKNRI